MVERVREVATKMTTERNIVIGIERLKRCTEFTNGTPSGNYNVTVANGSMTEGKQDDHIRKNVLFADGQSYDIAINVLSYSGSIILNFSSENGGLTSWQMVSSFGVINVNNLIGDETNAYIDFNFLGSATIELDCITITSDEEMIYHADVSSANSYNPFGSIQAARTYHSDIYAYSFNGMKDSEIGGEDNGLNFGARIYDSRLGMWMSRDAFELRFCYESPYIFLGNSMIAYKDEGGNFQVPKNVQEKYPLFSHVVSNLEKILVSDGDLKEYLKHYGH